jgi:hypothetical protein
MTAYVQGSTEGKYSSAITVTDKEGVPHASHIGLALCAAGREYSIERFPAKPHLGSCSPGFREVAAVMVTWLAPVPEAQLGHVASVEAGSRRVADPHQPATPQAGLQ